MKRANRKLSLPRLLAVLVTTAALGSACTASDATPRAAVGPTDHGAAMAGGACQLLDFGRVTERLSLSFAVAGAARRDKTNTCVLRPATAALPELSLSITPTTADVAVFKDTVPPKGSSTVSGLGKVAFQTTTPAGKGRGPSVEIGWLAGNARLLLLKLTLPADGDAATATTKLVELAKEIDKAGV